MRGYVKMTTYRGCGKFFTEGHDETKCELVAQSLDDRKKFVQKEFEYLKEIEQLEIERDKYKELYESSMLSEATAKQYAEQLESDVSTAIGTCAYMDPPDGGNVSLPEQVRRMRADRDALVAQVESLRKALAALSVQAESVLQEDIACYSALKRAQREADEVLDKTPQHHLRQVRADGGRDGFVACAKKYGNKLFDESELLAAAIQYHASTLAGKE